MRGVRSNYNYFGMDDDDKIVLQVALVVQGRVALLAAVAGAVKPLGPLQLVWVAFLKDELD